MSFDYNNAGQPVSVARGATAGACTYGNCFANGWSYSPPGGLLSGTFGPLTQTFTYNSQLQQTTATAAHGSTTLWFMTNTYSSTANNGNITSQAIDATGAGGISVTANFVYDNLNRLQSSTEIGTSGIKQTYGYDSVGNRWVDLGNSNFSPSTFTPTTPSWFDGATNRLTGVTYDTAGTGSQAAMGAYSFTYDAENRLNTSTIGSVTTVNTYDGDGKRVKKQIGSQAATIYVYDVAGELIAEYGGPSVAAGTQYIVQDHLGSTRMVVDMSGGVLGLHDMVPFGEEIPGGVGARTTPPYAVADGVTQKFTGNERDAETGLDYFGARYMSGAQGRFMSPDPLLNSGRPWDPQSWNRYNYVRNNPLSRIDPTGMYDFANCMGSAGQCAAWRKSVTEGIEQARQSPRWRQPDQNRAGGPS